MLSTNLINLQRPAAEFLVETHDRIWKLDPKKNSKKWVRLKYDLKWFLYCRGPEIVGNPMIYSMGLNLMAHLCLSFPKAAIPGHKELLFPLSSLVRPFTLGTHEAHTARGGGPNISWIHHPLFEKTWSSPTFKFCGFTVTKNSEFLRGPKKKRLRKQHWLNIPLKTSFDYTWSWDRLPLVHWNPTLHNHEGFLFWIKVWSKRQWKGTHVAM